MGYSSIGMNLDCCSEMISPLLKHYRFDALLGAVVRVKTLTLDPSGQRGSSQGRLIIWEEPVAGSLSGLLFSIESSLVNFHADISFVSSL